jgi:tetratricopeptide (TPR) repeat protein
MCKSKRTAFPRLAWVLCIGFGLVLYGQPPTPHDGGGFWFPGPPSSSSNPDSIAPVQAQDDIPFPPDDPPSQGSGTVTVAELQHPLSSKARPLLLKAQIAMRAGKFDECLENLDKAMKIASAVPYVHGVRGAAYLLRGRVPEAISELQQALQVLPIPANYSNLGYAHLLIGDEERGEQELRRAVEFHSPLLQARYLLGLLLLDRKPQNTEACDNLQRARSLMPAVHMALAVCYVRDGRDAAANGQIHEVLGPANESKFDFWKKWVNLVAAQPKPSTAFGLRIVKTPATPQ